MLISSWKVFSFLRFLSFCPDFFGHVGKRLDKKVMVNFKIHDFATWEANNYNTHITQNLKKQSQPDSEIWLINRI